MPLGRLALLDWRLPHCESGAASVMYAKQSSEGPGWVQTDDDVQLAVAAWRDGTLQAERFAGPPSPERRPRPFHGHGAAFNRMYGVRRSKQEEPVPFHQCNPSPAVSPYDPNCPHPSVRVERLEAFVLATIRERLLEAGAEERIREAILRAKRRDATKV
ncbi:MAG: hypothetical protein MUF25_22480, partial [Pirellulaceae bacterium]|nr:hypothetical protein [Pirellulaceae bacterium]